MFFCDAPIQSITIPRARGRDFNPRSPCRRVVEGAFHLLLSEVQVDRRPTAKQKIQEA
jgi:hypothetical protein